MNIASWLVLLLIAVALFYAVRASWRRRQSGSCGCGGHCGGCMGCAAGSDKSTLSSEAERQQ